jgi:hypothetical protein
MNIALSTVAVAIGLFVFSAPERAAGILNPQRMAKLSANEKVWFLRAYRLLGVSLTITGLLFAIDSIVTKH